VSSLDSALADEASTKRSATEKRRARARARTLAAAATAEERGRMERGTHKGAGGEGRTGWKEKTGN